MTALLDKSEVKVNIAKRIEATYHMKRSALFVPEQFVAAGLGSERDVIHALESLVEDSYLRARATLKCAFGHEYLSGTVADVQRQLHVACTDPTCESRELSDEERNDEENQPRVIVRYSMTKPWKEALDAAEKKSLHPA